MTLLLEVFELSILYDSRYTDIIRHLHLREMLCLLDSQKAQKARPHVFSPSRTNQKKALAWHRNVLDLNSDSQIICHSNSTLGVGANWWALVRVEWIYRT